MDFQGITWRGPSLDDVELLRELPEGLTSVLASVNGFILVNGALHVRGATLMPLWHSLREIWKGANSLSSLYPVVEETDVPFAQDCLGDQFLLRANKVWRLFAETGELEAMDCGLREFLEAAENDPIEFLSAQPLLLFQKQGFQLNPGKLLHAFPPYCTVDSGRDISLGEISADELIRFHADFASQIANVKDGEQIEIRIVD
jgi:hypothetical protein